MIKNILYVIIILLAATFCRAQENQVGTYYFIMAHDDYHERYRYEPRDYKPNKKFIGDNFDGFINKVYSLDRGILSEVVDLTQCTGRGQHLARFFIPSADLFILRTKKMIVYNLRSNTFVCTDSLSDDIAPGRYSRFFNKENILYYTNRNDNSFVNLKTLSPTDENLYTFYLNLLSDGQSISQNLFSFSPSLNFKNDFIYGYRSKKEYPIEKTFYWPPFVLIDYEIGFQKIDLSNNHVLLLVKWLNGANSSTGTYSLYNKYKDRWSSFKLPKGAPIRYQNGWLIGAFYGDDAQCTTTVNLNQYGEPQNLEDPFFARYTLKYGLWPNLKAMFCQHFIYHVDSERMGVVNLDDHDSEILYVFEDRVVYRIYDCIYEAPVNIIGDKIEVDRRSEQLLVQDVDIVPNIHYMYVKSQE